MNERINWVLTDYELKRAVDPHGGWPVVLSKDFDLPDELVQQLEKLTCSRELLMEARLHAREGFLRYLAVPLWLAWHHTGKLTSTPTPLDSNLRWQDYPNPLWWDEPTTSKIMKIYSISKDDVDLYINNHRAELPPTELIWPGAPSNSPLTQGSAIPDQPLPNTGTGEIAVPVAHGDED